MSIENGETQIELRDASSPAEHDLQIALPKETEAPEASPQTLHNSLSFDLSMTPRDLDSSKGSEARERRIEIAKKVVQVVLEILTILCSLAFVACLFVGSAIRTNYASTCYLTILLFTLAFPSSFGYYLYVPINRFWMFTPKLPLTIVTTILAAIFLTIQISFQIAYAAGATFEQTQLLVDFGIVQLSKMDSTLVSVNIIPEIIIVVFGALTVALQCTLWKLRIYWKRIFFEQQVNLEEKYKTASSFDELNSTFARAISQDSPNIHALDRYWLLLVIMVTGAIYPSFITIPYFILAIAYIVTVALPTSIPSWIMGGIMIGVAFYTSIIVYVLNNSRMWYLSFLRDTTFGRMTGFMNLSPLSLDFETFGWAYGLIICLFVLYITTCSIANKYYVARVQYVRDVTQNIATTTSTESSEKESLTQKVKRIFAEITLWLKNKTLNFLHHYFIYTLLIALPCFIMSVPNLLSMIYLLVLFIGLFSPNQLLVYVVPATFLYSLFYIVLQFVFNLPYFMTFYDTATIAILTKIGVSSVPYASCVIFGHMVVILLMAITIRVRLMFKPPPPAPKPVENTPKPEMPKSRLVRVLTTSRDIIINFFVRYSYYLSLLVLYFSDLTTPNADVLHAIYLLFFLLYFVFKVFARKAWIILVIYCQFVVATLYFFNVYYTTIVGEEYQTIGFVAFGHNSFWEGLVWHFVVLFIVTIQFHVQRLEDVAGTHIDRDKTLEVTFPNIRKVIQRIKILWKHFGIFLSYLAITLLVILDGKATVIGIGYLLLLYPYVIIHTIFSRQYRVLQICWYAIVLYNGVVFFAVYFYQFPLLRRLLDDVIATINPFDRLFMDASYLGLTQFQYKSASLLPYTVVLLLSIIQLRNFAPLKPKTATPAEIKKKSFVRLISKVDRIVKKITLIAKRACIMHHAKLLFIFVVVAAQLNSGLMGAGYFILLLLYAPIPTLSVYLWPITWLYSALIILMMYIFQFPYFKSFLQCDLPPTRDYKCVWLEWAGFQLYPSGNVVGYVLWSHIFVFVLALMQRPMNRWRAEMIKDGTYKPGVLVTEEEYTPKKVTIWTRLWSFTRQVGYFMCNHFFDEFGYDITLLTMIIAAMVLLQTVWGLVYLLIFGFCFFLPRRLIAKVWIGICLMLELNIVVLFAFQLTPLPSYDIYANLQSWAGRKMFNYIVLRAQDIQSKPLANPGVIAVMYLVLFFAFLQARVFAEKRHLYNAPTTSATNVSSPDADEANERQMSPPQLLRHYQKKDNAMHVKLPVYSTRPDFTVRTKPRNYYDEFRLLILYRFFNKVPLIIFFIDAAVSPGFLKVVQMALSLIYFNQINRIYWKTRYFWIGLGAFYYCITMIMALYQIPLTVVGEPGTNWNGQAWTLPFMRFFGMTSMADAGKITLTVLVFASYYIQDRIFLTEDYVFFINLLWKERERRKHQQARNRAFLAAQLVKRFAERSYLKKRREMAMKALKDYQRHTDDSSHGQDSLKKMYEQICESYKQNISEVHHERAVLEIALRKVVRSRQIQSAIVDSIDLEVLEELLQDAEKIAAIQIETSEHQTTVHTDKSERTETTMETADDHTITISAQPTPITPVEQDPLTQPEDEEDPFQAMAQTPRVTNRVEAEQEVALEQEKPPVRSPSVVTFGETITYEVQEDEGSNVSTDTHISIQSPREQKEDSSDDEEDGQTQVELEQVSIEEQPKIPTPESPKSPKSVLRVTIKSPTKPPKISPNQAPFIKTPNIPPLNISKDLVSQATQEKIKKKKNKYEKKARSFILTAERTFYLYTIWAIDLVISAARPMMSIALENRDDIVRILTDVAIKDDKAVVFTDYTEEEETDKPRKELALLLVSKLVEMKTSIINCVLSSTDTICYAAFVINLVYSPTIYNLVFTLGAFLYAAQQSPYPSRRYWEVSLLFTMCMMVFKYLMYLIQDAIYGTQTAPGYQKLQIVGWNPSTTLISDIIMYLVILLAIYFHRDTLKKRGEWTKHNRKKEEVQTPRRQVSLPPDMEEKESKEETQLEKLEASKSFRRRAMRYEKPMFSPRGVIQVVIEQEAKEKPSGPNVLVRVIQDTKAFIVQYYSSLTVQERKLGRDFYVISNLAHIVALIFFVICFNYMNGRPSDNITGDIISNQLSGTYVIILFFFFLEICVERVLYLKSALRLKILFLIVQVITYHIVYLVFYDVIQTNQNNTGVILLGVLFFFKCVSMWLSCLQIKNGYPTVGTFSQFFAKSYFWLFCWIYQLWRAIPFVFELKTILDWTFIRTSLSFGDWLKMEDIYRALYMRKCDRVKDQRDSRKFGHPRDLFTKISGGFIVFSVLCVLIFFPLIFYSTANPSLTYNTVEYISNSVGIKGFENMYSSSIDLSDSQEFNTRMNKLMSGDMLRKNFPDYLDDRVQVFPMDDFSDSFWTISVPSMKMLSYQLSETNKTLSLVFTTTIDRLGPDSAQTVAFKQQYSFTRLQRNALADMINRPTEYNDGKSDLQLGNVYSPYLLNKYDGLRKAVVAPEFLPNCTMGIRNAQNVSLYWVFSCTSYNFDNPGTNMTMNSTGIYFWIQSAYIVISDTNSILSLISGIGIIAFYTTFVLAVGNLVRSFASGLVGSIFYENVDNVDLLLSFVMDIYIARESRDIALEEIMFEQILRIFRDTSVLQIWTTTEDEEKSIKTE